MTRVHISPDCGNAPRKTLIKDLNIAFAKGDTSFIVQHAHEDIQWAIVGDKELKGKEAFSRELESMKEVVADEMTLHSIITHGAEAAANGEMKVDGKTYSFCDIYRFSSTTSTKIKKMSSYVIEI